MSLTTAEWLPFAIGSTFLWATDIGAVVFAWLNYRYAPLKAKNVPLITATVAASFLYWAGMSYSLGFFGKTSAATPLCSFVGIWLQYPLGLHAVLGVLLYRFLKLHRVLVQQKELDKAWNRKTVIISTVALLAIYVVVGSVFALGILRRHRVSDFSEIIPDKNNTCVIGVTELTISMGIAAMLLITLMVFLLRLRTSGKLFKEYNETCHGVYSQATSFIITAAFLFTGQSDTVFARYVLIFVNIISTDYYVWQVLGSTLYGCLFRREETLRRYHEDLDEHARQFGGYPDMSKLSFNDNPQMTSTNYRFQAGLKRPSVAVPGRRYLRDSVSTTATRSSTSSSNPDHALFTNDRSYRVPSESAGVRVGVGAPMRNIRGMRPTHPVHGSASVKDEELVQLAI
ncbi:hypothetical protein BDF19DRAFT_47203 [Syncephalis fuscata]|nr:hypothetical protein BDF19DRAFT_47203 [Syncephalis fuscata]